MTINYYCVVVKMCATSAEMMVLTRQVVTIEGAIFLIAEKI